MLPLEPWTVNQDSSLQRKYKEISATIGKLEDKPQPTWVTTLTTSIGPVTFSLSNSFSSVEDAKKWCNDNVVLAYGIKEPSTDKAFAEYQAAMMKYEIDLAAFQKNMEDYTSRMGVWIQQNSEWVSSKYRTPVRPGPQPTKPTTPAVDPGPMPVQPSPPIRPIDPRDMSPVRPPARPMPPRPGGPRSL